MPVFRLSILICTLPKRSVFLHRLRSVLDQQMRGQPVELLLDDRPKPVSTGIKRNALLDRARGDYIAFVDDDDLVSPTYVRDVLAALKGNPDCAELRGIITFDGTNPKPFVHTVHCDHWHERDGTYYRMANHLNAVKRDLAVKARFPEISFGEDHEFSKRLQPMIKTMGECKRTLYFYQSRSKKPEFD